MRVFEVRDDTHNYVRSAVVPRERGTKISEIKLCSSMEGCDEALGISVLGFWV